MKIENIHVGMTVETVANGGGEVIGFGYTFDNHNGTAVVVLVRLWEEIRFPPIEEAGAISVISVICVHPDNILPVEH